MPNNEVHIGQLVKSVFDDQNLSVSELARRLHCDRSNVYSIFQRRSIDVELLANLSKNLNHNFLEDAILMYELSSVANTQLSLNISLEKLSSEKIAHLTKVLAQLKCE